MGSAELALDCRNTHGEGVLWDPVAGLVWWADIHGKRLWSLDPASGTANSYEMPARPCCFAPRAAGGFIVAFDDRVSLFDLARGEGECLHRFEPDRPETRLNDGRTDRQGRFIAGGMDEVGFTPTSSVLRIDPDRSVTTIITGVGCANSTCFSADGRTMFFADTRERRIRAYDYDPATGALGDYRVFATLGDQPGVPDGSCIDADGGVWNAVWEGSRVIRFGPDGRVDRIVELPVLKPTCCAFGGADLDILFVTSSRLELDDDQLAAAPHSGGLFAIRTGFRGVADAPFAG